MRLSEAEVVSNSYRTKFIQPGVRLSAEPCIVLVTNNNTIHGNHDIHYGNQPLLGNNLTKLSLQ